MSANFLNLSENRTEKFLFLAGTLLIVSYILLFKPLSLTGDASTYMVYANTITENGNNHNLLHRSPFYPLLLAILISGFSNDIAIQTMVIIQYVLLLLSAMIIYTIMLKYVSGSKVPACLSATFIMINLSSLFYCYILLPEALTLFLLILSLWFIIKSQENSKAINFILAGSFLSIMALTRFNTMPMLFVFTVIIFMDQLLHRSELLRTRARNIIVFLLPGIIILNGYAFKNYLKHDFYGLFPAGGSTFVSRNALIKTIDGSEKVSVENIPVLNIFKKAKGNIPINIKGKKGSLENIDRLNLMGKLNGGFQIYTAAKPELYKYFNINPVKPEPELSNKLKPFFSEVKKIHRGEVWRLRFLSLLSSFRSSSGIVIPEEPDTNLGRLPGWLIQTYKLSFLALSTLVFISSLVYLILIIFKYIKPNNTIVLFIIAVFGFFFINFAFAAVGDSNRYKYPADPLIIVLGVYFIYRIFGFLKSRNIKQKQI